MTTTGNATLQDLFMYRHTIDGDPKTPVEQASRARYYAKMAIAAGHEATVEQREAPGSDVWMLHEGHTSAAIVDAAKVPEKEKKSIRSVPSGSVRKALAEMSRVCSTLSRGTGNLSVPEFNILAAATDKLLEYVPDLAPAPES